MSENDSKMPYIVVSALLFGFVAWGIRDMKKNQDKYK
jgi:hypothetical protein